MRYLKIGKSTETENSFEITSGWGRGNEELLLNGYKEVMKTFWK